VELTAERLRELVNYATETGLFTWNKRRPHCRPGDPAGGLDKDGYWRVGLFGRQYLAHHLAWLYVYGCWPDGEPDHKNLLRSDNRIENIRPATRRQNIANSGLRKTNTSGFKGVYWCTQIQKWKARIRDGKRHIYLGSFDRAADAGEAYKRAAVAMYGEFARVAYG